MGNQLITEKLHLASVRKDMLAREPFCSDEENDEPGNTFLMKSAIKGNSTAVHNVLKSGFNINSYRDLGGESILFKAAKYGHVLVVLELLDNDANVDQPDEHGRTPLMAAIINRKIEVMSLLIEGGANINAIARNGYTALLYAAISLSAREVKMLMDKGANCRAAHDMINFGPLDGKGPIRNLLESTIDKSLPTSQKSSSDDSEHKDGHSNNAPKKNCNTPKHKDPESIMKTTEKKQKQHRSKSKNNTQDRRSFESSNGYSSDTDHIPASTSTAISSKEHVWNGIIIPGILLCPIGHELMVDPVICADGYSYERFNIESWMVDNSKSPMTNTVFDDKELVSDQSLLKLISAIQSSANKAPTVDV